MWKLCGRRLFFQFSGPALTIHSPNLQCGMWYRRVIEIEDDEDQDGVSLSGRPYRQNAKNAKTAKAASSIGVAPLNEIETEEKPSDFRRVSIISKWNSKTSRYMTEQIAAWRRGMISGMCDIDKFRGVSFCNLYSGIRSAENS